MTKYVPFKLLIVSLIFFNSGSLIRSVFAEQLAYDETNRFWHVLQDPINNLDTKLLANTKHTLSFDDNNKLTKEHILFIPKGKYSSFISFADKASPEEVTDFFRTISQVAEQMKLNSSGYRLISNHSLTPGKKTNNDASQKIAHFHVHMAGDECLGIPIAGASTPEETRKKIDMSLSKPPFGFDMSQDQFLQYVSDNTLAQVIFQDTQNGLRKVVAYKLPGEALHLKEYIGFVLLDAHGKSAYPSIQDFAQHGTENELTTVLKSISYMSKKISIHQTGFRLIINHGNDGEQYPKDVLQIAIAGGSKMGETVTNVYGNRKPKTKDESGDMAYRFEDLKSLPHEHCLKKQFQK